jgi:Ca2+-transporting ATPase
MLREHLVEHAWHHGCTQTTQGSQTMIAHHGTAQDVVNALRSNNEQRGLSQPDARSRLEKYGTNELESELRVPGWRRFLAQFKNVLVLLLLVAAVISGVLWYLDGASGVPYEALAILAVVLLNAVMGYIQETRAENAVAALRQMAAAHARVLRDGQMQSIPATELVPGDILRVEEGDSVPADARLIHSSALHLAEGVLTGESVPVLKDAAPISGEVEIGDRYNMLFSGTVATSGRGTAIIVATGMQTEVGRIAGLLTRTQEEKTPLQAELARVGKLLGASVVVLAAVMIATILLVEDIRGVRAMFDVLILGVALAVAAVPEGLPAVVTAVLSLGVQRAARRNAIVRRLSAVETLGSTTLIASDKTGTLTKNEMTVRVVVTSSGRVRFGGSGYVPEGEVIREGGGEIEGPFEIELERTLAAADRANNAALVEQDGTWSVQGDPTEGALIVAARKVGLDGSRLAQRFSRIAEIPFSSERKLMSTIHSDAQHQDRVLALTKGAPDVLLSRCTGELVGEDVRPLDESRRTELLGNNDELAGQALRTIAVAYRSLPKRAFDPGSVDESIEDQLVFLGLIGMIDPPRDEAKPAVARTKSAGIRPIMITGDHPKTASVIATELGISDQYRAVSGAELSKMSEEQLDATVRRISVYARVDPEHKLRIVASLQRQGEVVAMTGDGVNDAPALKVADIGIAMGRTGTDVSKEAADMVLADDNYATIVNAVEEGRSIYVNIRKFLRYLLASNVGEVLTMFLGVLLGSALGLTADREGVVLPLLATQLLWINLVSDGAPALALGVEPAEPRLMERPPRPRSERVITRRMWRWIVVTGAFTAVGTLLVLDASLPAGWIEGDGDMRYAQTMAFTTLVFFSLFTLFAARSDTRSAFSGLLTNKWLLLAALLSLLLQIAVVHVPPLQRAFSTASLSAADWLRCAAVGSTVLWFREVTKLIARARARRQAAPPTSGDTPIEVERAWQVITVGRH